MSFPFSQKRKQLQIRSFIGQRLNPSHRLLLQASDLSKNRLFINCNSRWN
jgi:hypothetical protein